MSLLDLGRDSADEPSTRGHLRAVDRLLDDMDGGERERSPQRTRDQRARQQGDESNPDLVTCARPVETDICAFERDVLDGL